jgi:ribosomal subunit interface protein
MKLTVKGKDMDLGESLRAQVEETLSRISQRYFHDPVDATVSFGRRAHEFSVHISLHVGRGINGEANGSGRSAYEALFSAGEAVAKQLRRLKRRLRHHPRHEREFTLDRPDHEPEQAVDRIPGNGHGVTLARRILREVDIEDDAESALRDEPVVARRAAGRRARA